MLFAPVCDPPVDSEEPAAMTGVTLLLDSAVSKPVGWPEPVPLVRKPSKARPKRSPNRSASQLSKSNALSCKSSVLALMTPADSL